MTKKQFNDLLNKQKELKTKMKLENPTLYWLLYEDINQEWDSRDILYEIVNLAKNK